MNSYLQNELPLGLPFAQPLASYFGVLEGERDALKDMALRPASHKSNRNALVTWAKSFNISNYMASKTRSELTNNNRKMAQKLMMLKNQRSDNRPPMVKLNRHGKRK